MEKVRFGLIGCGNIVKIGHAPALEKLIQDGEAFEFTAACDNRKAQVDMIAARFGVKAYTDYRDMLDDVDCVMIATPHTTHYEIAHFFITHDKHVLLEKPLCNTREEVVSLIEESEKHDVIFQCAYPVPYWPGISIMKELLDSGKYGKINQMSIWTEQYTGPKDQLPLHPGSVNWRGSAYYRNPYLKDALGGGQLWSHGCHYIDILLWFLGDPEKGVHMGTNTCTPWMEREGNSNVIIMFKNGTMGYHYGTWGARGSTHEYAFQVHTDEGMFEYLDKKAVLKFTSNYHPDPDKRTETIWNLGSTVGHATWREIQHFFQCIREHKQPLTNGRRALRGLDVIWALYDAEDRNCIADLSHI